MINISRNRQGGFTLIELMIVVVIIGILAAMAIPRFMSATTRTKQSEAKQILKQVYTMQHTFRTHNGSYGDDGTNIPAQTGGTFSEIGVEVMATSLYGYDMVANATTFTCTATGNIDDDPTDDVWTIDELGNLVNVIGNNDVVD